MGYYEVWSVEVIDDFKILMQIQALSAQLRVFARQFSLFRLIIAIELLCKPANRYEICAQVQKV